MRRTRTLSIPFGPITVGAILGVVLCCALLGFVQVLTTAGHLLFSAFVCR
jgi:hypothetical protein